MWVIKHIIGSFNLFLKKTLKHIWGDPLCLIRILVLEEGMFYLFPNILSLYIPTQLQEIMTIVAIKVE